MLQFELFFINFKGYLPRFTPGKRRSEQYFLKYTDAIDLLHDREVGYHWIAIFMHFRYFSCCEVELHAVFRYDRRCTLNIGIIWTFAEGIMKVAMLGLVIVDSALRMPIISS